MKFITNRKLVTACLVAGICVFAASWLQPKFLYFQRRYDEAEKDEMKMNMKRRGYEINTLTYTVENLKQYSFLVYPTEILGTPSSVSVFVLMGGNGMTALDWIDWIVDIRPHLEEYPNVAFILVDYPGYGLNEGHPSPASMNQAVEGSVSQGIGILKAFGLNVRELNILGHSIGAAVASKWVSSLASTDSDLPRIRRLVLSAPFTSISEMIPIVFPFIPSPVATVIARHNWCNREALSSIVDARNVGSVYIVHGEQDEIVPFEMGRELSRIGDGAVTFVPLKSAMHNDILSIVKLYGLILSAPIPHGYSESKL
jgi:hypothetical protein